MFLSLYPGLLVDFIGSLAVIVITFTAVRTSVHISRYAPDVLLFRYLFYQSIVLFVFAAGRATGHIIKRVLLLADRGDIWDMISPLSGGLNTLTFVAFSIIILMYVNVRSLSRQIKALIAEKKRYKSLLEYKTRIFDSMLFPAVVISEEYEILDANRPFIETYQGKNRKIIGRKCYEVTHGLPHPCASGDHPCAVKDVIEKGKTLISIHRHRTPIGDRVFELYTSPVYFEHIHKHAVIEVCRDITDEVNAEAERERLRRQIFQSQKTASLKTITEGIAHEFNNILVGILGNAELILQMSSDSRLRDRADKIIHASQRAEELIKKMLYCRRAMQSPKRPFNFRLFINDFYKIVLSSKPANVDATLRLDIDDITLTGDPEALNEAFINIVKNAFQAMPEGGRLEIDIYQTRKSKNDYLVIEFRDSGEGIEPQVLERIFDPFFTTRDVGSGTGLGLFIVRGIVESHEGEIEVKSTTNKGTSVVVYLPCH